MLSTSLDYTSIKENSILGRYLDYPKIETFLKGASDKFEVKTIGKSVQGTSIELIFLGTGKQKILMWSQMHGNESTTTKAVLDLVNFLQSAEGNAKNILQNCTIAIIPMLNPDGAAAYTRPNANGVDLNRDAQKRSQPESQALRRAFDDFRPDFCFNLHDQRTIYSVGDTPKPATVSFLSPAQDEVRSVTPSRTIGMQLIVAMNEELQRRIPGQVGRYDDAFNADCVGDTFQMTATPTVLFEAGHHPDDYERERTREYIFYALVTALITISEDRIGPGFDRSRYFSIPENNKLFFDVLIKNAHHIDPSLEKGGAIGLLYIEIPRDDTIDFIPKIEKTGNLDGYFGHTVYDALLDRDLKALKRSKFLPTYFPISDNLLKPIEHLRFC